MEKLSDIVNRKFIREYPVEDYEIYSEDGWHDILTVYKTIPYKKYIVKTENFSLSGADTHIIFYESEPEILEEIYLKDVCIGMKIMTETGLEEVVSVEDTGIEENMYDLEINSLEHTYFSNGILSHNSTSYTVYCLWYALTNIDKKILICANKFKTAKDILSRIKMAYEMLPNWMKPRNYYMECV